MLYLAMMAAVLAVAALLIGYGYIESSGDTVAVCNPSSAFRGQSQHVWNGFNHVISFTIIFVYSAAHVKCRQLSGNVALTKQC
ncbi:hypothetical protein OSTOST_14394 [Ostertagia ostertagi]